MKHTIVDLGRRQAFYNKMMLNTVPPRPPGADLIVYESGTDPLEGMVLYGFDEVETFVGNFKNPHYCYCQYELDDYV